RSTAACMPASPPYDACTITHCGAQLWPALIGKLALVWPAGTVTPPLVTTSPSMLPFTQTTAPPGGAGPVSVTVPVVLPPPSTLAVATVTEDSAGAGAGDPAGKSVSLTKGARKWSLAVPVSRVTR